MVTAQVLCLHASILQWTRGRRSPTGGAAHRNVGLHKVGRAKGQTPGGHQALCSQQVPVSSAGLQRSECCRDRADHTVGHAVRDPGDSCPPRGSPTGCRMLLIACQLSHCCSACHFMMPRTGGRCWAQQLPKYTPVFMAVPWHPRHSPAWPTLSFLVVFFFDKHQNLP